MLSNFEINNLFTKKGRKSRFQYLKDFKLSSPEKMNEKIIKPDQTKLLREVLDPPVLNEHSGVSHCAPMG